MGGEVFAYLGMRLIGIPIVEQSERAPRICSRLASNLRLELRVLSSYQRASPGQWFRFSTPA